MVNIPRLYVAAIKKTSGKTTVAIALNRILSQKDLVVQPFKKGPDFIDPMWHTQAARRTCRNLDFFFLSKDKLVSYFLEKIQRADIAVIEGNHGLFDDIKAEGGSDNAALAKLLSVPVILVLDVKETGRSIVPIILGCQQFDRDIKIGGVILNRVQSDRQKKVLIEAIKMYTNVPILGAIPESKDISILQRHLGLSATLKSNEKENIISNIADYLERFLDIEKIIKIANSAEGLSETIKNKRIKSNENFNLNIGIAKDEAFNFYYPDNLELLKSLGCSLNFFSPMEDKLPEADALYIGGGFPELYLNELESNIEVRTNIKKFVEDGKPVYAECGGLAYLTNKITFNEAKGEMVSAIDAETVFQKKPVGHGYTILKPIVENKGWWNNLKTIKGHEFHHALLKKSNNEYAFKIERGFGINGTSDGLIVKNSLASFTHIYAPGNPEFFIEWVKFVKYLKQSSV